jgi:hypothetical protein
LVTTGGAELNVQGGRDAKCLDLHPERKKYPELNKRQFKNKFNLGFQLSL